jgi:hypothetical protein
LTRGRAYCPFLSLFLLLLRLGFRFFVATYSIVMVVVGVERGR